MFQAFDKIESSTIIYRAVINRIFLSERTNFPSCVRNMRYYLYISRYHGGVSLPFPANLPIAHLYGNKAPFPDSVCVMVLILDGNSDIAAHSRSNLYLIS